MGLLRTVCFLFFFVHCFERSQGWAYNGRLTSPRPSSSQPPTIASTTDGSDKAVLPSGGQFTSPRPSSNQPSTIASTMDGGDKAVLTSGEIIGFINAGLSVLTLATLILIFAYFRWKWANVSTRYTTVNSFDRLRFRTVTGQDDSCERCCVHQTGNSGITYQAYCIHRLQTETSNDDQSDTHSYINIVNRRNDQPPPPDDMYLNVTGRGRDHRY